MHKKQHGALAAILLPWLLFITLAGIFWWFVMVRQDDSTKTTQAIAQTQDTAALSTKQQASTDSAIQILPQTPVVSYRDAVLQAAPSVVNIYTTQNIQNPYANDPVLSQFLQFHGYDIPRQNETNLGSGVVVSKEGYIVTNAHVIDRADEIVVALFDGRKASAKIIGTDKESDLAIIQIALDNLTPIVFKEGDSAVGDVVLAIGNPFGVGQTVTQGIVSATGRTGLGVNTYEDFIQTDAAINPGNSGGALVDAYGQLIGINTMIYSRSGGSMGIGFAIPTTLVQKVMQDIIATGKVSRGWLGIEVGRTVNDPTRLESSTGVVVAHVMDNSPAAQAGLQSGDIIESINGTTITDGNALVQYIARQAPNSTLTIQIQRNQLPLTLTVLLSERPQVQ